MEQTYKEQRVRYLQYLGTDGASTTDELEPLRTTPLFSLAVKHAVEKAGGCSHESEDSLDNTSLIETDASDSTSDREIHSKHTKNRHGTQLVLPQFGLLGFDTEQSDHVDKHEPIFLNVHAPNSAFICGSQGSGKSYTLACMLENCLLADRSIGSIVQPVAGLAFHYDADASGTIAEVAYLCSRGIKVDVLVSNSNYAVAKKAYSALPGARDNLRITPFLLPPSELSIDRMHKLMAFSESSNAMPLYMEVIQRILRNMAQNGQGRGFNYSEFLRQLNAEGLTKGQQDMMNLRLALLQSFMKWPPSKADMRSSTPQTLLKLLPGTLTIVDLSDPFVDSATICVLFDICLGLAKEKRPECGLVIALDEAHRYMDDSPAATNFTNRILATVREQRHVGARILIATQEPTISEKMLDLCTVTIVHHFKSPAWFLALRNHLGGASGLVNDSDEQKSLFEQIMDLGVGESLVFAPRAFVRVDVNRKPKKLGADILRMRTRMRKGVDGGASVMAGQTGPR